MNPEYVWAIESRSDNLFQMHYVAVETEADARQMAQERNITVTEIKRVLNVTHLVAGEWRQWM